MSEDPKTIGRYEVVRRIARGGMGTVYLVNARGAGGFVRRLALKECHPHLVDEPEFVARFLDEGRIAARIHHPNVVATIDVVHEGSELYLVMEYVDGAPLSALTKRSLAGEVIPLGACVRIALDALAGLEAAHTLTDDAGVALGVAHRDVSPQNVIVGRDGLARLTDFGIARARDNSAHSREGEVRGKFGYMAPEQLLGSPVDARADVFAMGVVLWELVAGHGFRSNSSSEAIASITGGTRAEAPSVHGRAVPAALDAVILKALARDPAARHATAAELAADLEAAVPPSSHREVAVLVAQSASSSDVTPSATIESPPPLDDVEVVSIPRATAPITVEVAEPPRRARWVAFAAVAGVLLLGGTIAYVGFARHEQPASTSVPSVSSSPVTPTASASITSDPTPPIVSAVTSVPSAHATSHVHGILTRPSTTTHKSSAPWHPAGP